MRAGARTHSHFHAGKRLGNAPEESFHVDTYNQLSVTLRTYFNDNFRPDSCIDFFSRFMDQQPALAIHVAEAHMQMGMPEIAEAALKKALSADAESCVLNIALSGVYCECLKLSRCFVICIETIPLCSFES